MEQKYDHVLIHAESSPEGIGTEIRTAGQGYNLIKMIALIIASLSRNSGIPASVLAAAVVAELPNEVRHSKSNTVIDLGAIERAKEGLAHE